MTRSRRCTATRTETQDNQNEGRQSFDLSKEPTTYFEEVSSTLSDRRLSVLAVMVIAMTGVLPAPHLHAADGHATVHVHGEDTGAAHASDTDHDDHHAFDHADHSAAQTLDRAFDVAARFVISHVLIAEPAPAATAVGLRTRLSRSHILPTHDPPIRFTSSPAPPAVV